MERREALQRVAIILGGTVKIFVFVAKIMAYEIPEATGSQRKFSSRVVSFSNAPDTGLARLGKTLQRKKCKKNTADNGLYFHSMIFNWGILGAL